jgi:hypothetical protein
MAGMAKTVNVTVAAPTTAQITGTLTLPTGHTDIQTFVTQQIGVHPILLCQGFTNALGAKIPVIAAGKATMYAESSLNGAASYVVHPEINANTDASFTMLAPASLTAPAAAATGVNLSTDFTWTAPTTDVVQSLRVTTGGTTKVAWYIYTTATTARVPNIPEQTSMPTAQTYTWSVAGVAPHNTVNSIATATGPEGASQNDFVGPRHAYTISANRTFTSQ